MLSCTFGQRVRADEAFEQGGIPSVRLYADREAALGELLHQFDEVIFLRRRALGKVEAGNPAVQQVAARDAFEGVPGQVGDDFPDPCLMTVPSSNSGNSTPSGLR